MPFIQFKNDSVFTDGKAHVCTEEKDITLKQFKAWLNLIPDQVNGKDVTLESVGFDCCGYEAINSKIVRLTIQSGRLRIEGVDEFS